MRVTTWTEYSLLIAIHLGRRGDTRGPVPARELAEEERLPPDYVEQILIRLRRAGLVESTRGAKGGYRLARSPAAISVRDVMEAAEGQTFALTCDTHPIDSDRCGPAANCTIRPVWRALQQRIDDLLGSVSLASLLREEAAVESLVGSEAG